MYVLDVPKTTSYIQSIFFLFETQSMILES